MPFVTRKSLTTMTLLTVVAVLLVLGFVWSGLYNVGADDPHTRPMLAMMQSLRANSIHARSKHLQAPNLDDPQLVLKGAGQYAAMCTGCHLAPGMEDSEIRPGLYPQPPNLSQVRIDPKDAFWVIKHGVKMSAMPAWGLSHDDMTIWSMVAFLQKLPGLSPSQYQELVAKAPPDEEMEGGGHHHGSADQHGPQAPAHEHTHDDAAADDHGAARPASNSAPMDGYDTKAVPAAEAVAVTFHAALQAGDRSKVMALLAPEVKVIEGGETQTRDEYAAHHLGEDIAFLKPANVKSLFLGSMPMGDTAMVGSRSEIRTTHDGQALALLSTETLTLKHTNSGWFITRIEWASERQAL
jgi:ketosteroid isomerase-like protein